MNIIKLNQTDSTNNYAKALIKQGKAEDRQVIFANEQTAGRGQAGNHWESARKKNFLFSLIFEPSVKPDEQFLISQAVSVGILNYLNIHIFNEFMHIKWPNDIYYKQKKIAGILIENTIQNDEILFSIIGVGLNMNQRRFSKNAGNPTSLSLETHINRDLEKELRLLVYHILKALESLRFGKSEEIKKRYLEHLLFRNEWREFQVKNEKIFGKIIGVNRFGFLQLQTENGTILEFGIKEISYLF